MRNLFNLLQVNIKALVIGLILGVFFAYLNIVQISAANNINPFLNTNFYINPDSQAFDAHEQTLDTDSAAAQKILDIAQTPQAIWFGGWNTDIRSDVETYVTGASNEDTLPVLVAYNIPSRDCSGHSTGGASNPDEYKQWITQFSQGIGDNKAVVIFEPDGLGLIYCWNEADQETRLGLYRYAMETFASQNPNAYVYIDSSMWINPMTMSELLLKSGIQSARGVSVNVAGFQTTEESTSYITNLKTELGLPIFGVIDTSRNGLGPDPELEWCNPLERALGEPSTAETGNENIDAYFWIKRPGESDGVCNGGPSAGNWWQDYALDLYDNSPFFTENEEPTPPTTSNSILKIYAAGTSAGGVYPNLEIVIKGETMETLTGVTGNPFERQFIEFTYSQTEKINPQDVTLKFVNDAGLNGEDRNVIIDKINIDGSDYETEDQSTYSIGSWNSTSGCEGGFKVSEWLHCNGFVSYSNTDSAHPPMPTPTDGFDAEFFNNLNLSGSPIIQRIDPEISFDWGGGSPDSQVNNDGFSTRWTKSMEFSSGIYKFSLTADDGIRLYIDDQLVIDKWINQAATTYEIEEELDEGIHQIKIEYFENGGNAFAKFEFNKIGEISTEPSPQPSPSPVVTPIVNGPFIGEYFSNKALTGTPKYIEENPSINFDWGGASPSPLLASDNFSIRWTQIKTLTEGLYNVSLTADDGIRLYIDDQLIIDQWVNQPPTTYSQTVNLSEGDHKFVIEYYEEGGGAVVKFNFTPQENSGEIDFEGKFEANYFSTRDLSGPVILTQADELIDFNWGGSSPHLSIAGDNFSVRWIKSQEFEDDNYEFTLTGDDGYRLYIDDELVIDKWIDQASTRTSIIKDMTAGPHHLKIEYYENGGEAQIKFNFQKALDLVF